MIGGEDLLQMTDIADFIDMSVTVNCQSTFSNVHLRFLNRPASTHIRIQHLEQHNDAVLIVLLGLFH
jgi:hypothetical protein